MELNEQMQAHCLYIFFTKIKAFPCPFLQTFHAVPSENRKLIFVQLNISFFP